MLDYAKSLRFLLSSSMYFKLPLLSRVRIKGPLVNLLLRKLLATQLPDGSFPAGWIRGNPASIEATVRALEVLRIYGFTEAFEKALRYIVNKRNRSGFWSESLLVYRYYKKIGVIIPSLGLISWNLVVSLKTASVLLKLGFPRDYFEGLVESIKEAQSRLGFWTLDGKPNLNLTVNITFYGLDVLPQRVKERAIKRIYVTSRSSISPLMSKDLFTEFMRGLLLWFLDKSRAQSIIENIVALQRPDGGFPSKLNVRKSNFEFTLFLLLNWLKLKKGLEPKLKNILQAETERIWRIKQKLSEIKFDAIEEFREALREEGVFHPDRPLESLFCLFLRHYLRQISWIEEAYDSDKCLEGIIGYLGHPAVMGLTRYTDVERIQETLKALRLHAPLGKYRTKLIAQTISVFATFLAQQPSCKNIDLNDISQKFVEFTLSKAPKLIRNWDKEALKRMGMLLREYYSFKDSGEGDWIALLHEALQCYPFIGSTMSNDLINQALLLLDFEELLDISKRSLNPSFFLDAGLIRTLVLLGLLPPTPLKRISSSKDLWNRARLILEEYFSDDILSVYSIKLVQRRWCRGLQRCTWRRSKCPLYALCPNRT
ncbi:MAG: hypothetical protein DRJ59_00315 [Thermoprotei archaeon]|nr:MAG: hypothetical protein DRJ59_00315 [Thermoprotei archaeon]